MTIFNGLLEAKKGALKNGAIPALYHRHRRP
ncbi:hypothetical protein ECO2947_11370 [Escherichia coli]|nr:hypothetical protein ECO2947_11370 [Escherichia coli]